MRGLPAGSRFYPPHRQRRLYIFIPGTDYYYLLTEKTYERGTLVHSKAFSKDGTVRNEKDHR
jgi:hypothetical protein